MKNNWKSFTADILRSVFYGILVSFVAVLIFAVIVKTFSLSEKVIEPVNAGLKTISILLGTLIGLKDKKQGLVKGLLIGIVYIVSTYLIFSLADGGFGNAVLTIFDVLLGLVVGAIAGVTKVNLYK